MEQVPSTRERSGHEGEDGERWRDDVCKIESTASQLRRTVINRLPLLDFPARTSHPETIATENPSKLDQVPMRRWRPKLARESAFPSSSERLAFNVQAPYFEIAGETNVDEFLYSPSWARHPHIRVESGATSQRIRVIPEFPLISLLSHNLRFREGVARDRLAPTTLKKCVGTPGESRSSCHRVE